jgi:hypothetical protein
LEKPTAKEVARVHLYFITPASSSNSWIPESCEVLALSENEDELNDVEDSLSYDNRPESPSSDFAGSHKLQEVDSKRCPRQCRCNNARCLSGTIMSETAASPE